MLCNARAERLNLQAPAPETSAEYFICILLVAPCAAHALPSARAVTSGVLSNSETVKRALCKSGASMAGASQCEYMPCMSQRKPGLRNSASA